MPLAGSVGVVCRGIGGQLVDVQVHLANGLPRMTIVGLADTAVSESRDRVRSAVVNSGFEWPSRRITVGLSPASEHKRGSGLDLPVAVAVLTATGSVPAQATARAVFVGELALDGSVRAVGGAISIAMAVRDALGDGSRIYAAESMAREMALVPGLVVVPTDRLGSLVAELRGERRSEAVPVGRIETTEHNAPDLHDVVGQPDACTALEVAAAGGHHMLMEGPPGVGKTMLAERLPGLLPPLQDRSALEVGAIRGAAAGSASERPSRTPPFIAPHHSASHAAMVGSVHGGTARPGLISLAHCGVLFLDEAPEFHRVTLESLRQPMEHGHISIARSGVVERLPARFQLILAANLCPCGGAGNEDDCRCSSVVRRRYRDRLSRPLRDRVDLRIRVSKPVGDRPAVGSSRVLERVLTARERSTSRVKSGTSDVNARVSAAELRSWALRPAVAEALGRWGEDARSSPRSQDRILRVTWTLADLNDRAAPSIDDAALAMRLHNGCGIR